MTEGPLELETRRDIYELVRSAPGLHMREIQRRLDLSIALVEYHLRFLEEAGVITSIAEEGYRRYYPALEGREGPALTIGAQQRRVLSLLRQVIPLRITLFLMTKESASLTEMSTELGMSPSRLSFHLKKLVGRGVVRRLARSEGRGYALVDRPGLARLLIAYRPTPDMLDEVAELWDSLDLG